MRVCNATGFASCDGDRQLLARALMTTRVGEPDAGNLHVRFDEGEQRSRCSLLDILRIFVFAVSPCSSTAMFVGILRMALSTTANAAVCRQGVPAA